MQLVPGNSPAYGSSCDAHKGTLTEDICIKQLRITVSGDREKVEKVPRLLSLRLGSRQLTNPKLFCTEVIVWKRLNHPNIVPLRVPRSIPFSLSWNGCLAESCEYIKEGQRVNYINFVGLILLTPNNSSFSTQLLDIAEGLGYLHSCNVTHRDLKGVRAIAHPGAPC